LPHPDGAEDRHETRLRPDAIGIVKNWCDDIVCLIATAAVGEISRVDVHEPLFLNWTAPPFPGKTVAEEVYEQECH